MTSQTSRTGPTNKTELLAPAGSLDAAFASLDQGADAIYCGLKEFSARAKAKNFTIVEVERLVAYAHRLHRRVYVTLNTLIKEAELQQLVAVLADLAAADVDGIIIQDLGVWRLARRFFPQLSLHASTQMTVHNAAGVRMLEKMGFARAVLARELSLPEIAAIRQQTAIELEHFVHGALCFAVSGQCFFSSVLSGQSGNRGRCAQPCRRRYDHRGRPGYYFSTSDLCAIELLPELIKAGITSFKIEGRMKSAEYVARVVAAYRLVLDAPAEGRKAVLRHAAELLALSFGRQSTKGFLTGFVPAGLAAASRQGAIGQQLGEIASLKDGLIGLVVSDRLHVGDRLRIQPASDQAGAGFTVREIRAAGDKKVKAVRAGDFVRIRNDGKGVCRVGDAVFKVGGKPFFTLSPEACQAKLAAISLAETGGRREEAQSGARLALAALLPGRIKSGGTGEGLELTIRVRDIQDLLRLEPPRTARFELLLTPEHLAQAGQNDRRLALLRERISWEIPAMLFGAAWQEYRRAVQILAAQGYVRFRLNNLGHVPLFAGLAGLTLLGGFRCYTMNSQAALAWQELGLAEAAASPEDDRENLRELCGRPLALPLAVTVYGPLPVLLSRIPRREVRPGSLLYADRGEGLRVRAFQGLTEVSGEHDFSLLGHLRELREMGCGRIMVDLSHCGAASPKGQAVLAAVAEDHALPDTSAFNYERGLA